MSNEIENLKNLPPDKMSLALTFLTLLERMYLYSMIMTLPEEIHEAVLKDWEAAVKTCIDEAARDRTDMVMNNFLMRIASDTTAIDGEALRLQALEALKVAKATFISGIFGKS